MQLVQDTEDKNIEYGLGGKKIMAKFNIEVELDWIEEEGYSIDEELKERVVEGIENALLKGY